jgi:ABC-type lipoprotein export system ATPase subunit
MIKMSNICKTYFGKGVKTKVLKGIDLIIDEGEFVCIYGPSGCGKTTLLNIIGLMDSYTNGNYNFNGIEIDKKEDEDFNKLRNREFGYIFQDFNLISDLNVLENVCVPMGYAGVGKKVRENRAKELLNEVGMIERAKYFPIQLSGGEKQRIAIARALSNKPKVILADEPTGSLDQKNGLKIMEILKELNRQGKTIIMVTHDKELSRYATKIIKIVDGKIDDKLAE